MSTLTIGKLAKEAGVTAETLRYYEHRGLVTPAQRTTSGYRLYHPDAIRRLRFIRRAQTLGFSLDEITELLSLSDNQTRSAAEVKHLIHVKVSGIDARIHDLERIKAGLIALKAPCSGDGTTADCPILATFNQKNDWSYAAMDKPAQLTRLRNKP